MKVCPFCAEEIQDAAIVCKHCGRDLAAPTLSAPTGAPTPPAPRRGSGGPSLLLILIAIGVIGAVALSLLFAVIDAGSKPVATAAATTAAAKAPPAPPPAKPVPPRDVAADQKVLDAVATFLSTGLVQRIDPRTGEVMISLPLWAQFNFDQKRNIVKVLSDYREFKYGLSTVTLRESMNGHELASYGVFSGVTIK